MLELSSFQLDNVAGFEPTAGAILNLTQDHLDWHGDMASYGQAKARIFGRGMDSATVIVANRDDAAVEALVPAPVFVKGTRGKPGRTVSRRVVRFGLNAPARAGMAAGLAILLHAVLLTALLLSFDADTPESQRAAGPPAIALTLSAPRARPGTARKRTGG